MQPMRETFFTRLRTRLLFILPVLLAAVTLGMVIGLIAALPDPRQQRLVADWSALLLLLCPAVICIFPVVILFVSGIVVMSRALIATERTVERIGRWSSAAADTAEKRSEQAVSWLAELFSHLSFLDPILDFFDPPAPDKEENSGDVSETKH